MADTAAIDAVLCDAVTVGDVPGVIAAAGTRDGVIYQGAFGQRSLATDAAMTADTVCWVASMTKAVTGACVMHLVERGKLELDAPVAELVPDLGRVQVLDGFDATGQPLLRAPKRKITLRHLMTHTSGYSYDMWNGDVLKFQKLNQIPGVISCRNKALATPLTFDPGDRWDYGISIDWAGKVVEAAAGMKLGAYMKAHILEPLRMSDTGFYVSAEQHTRRAAIHMRTPEGLAATRIEITAEPEFEMGGGGLYSTAGDYLKFARMILGGGALDGTRVLHEETVRLMARNAMGEIRCRALKTALPGTSNDVDFVEGMEWGLTFMINPQPLSTGRSAGSLAWAGLANSYYWIDPARDVAGVFITQILPFADVKALPLFRNFETAVYKSL